MQFGKVGCRLTKRTHDGYDARESYERARDAMGENVRVGNDDIELEMMVIPLEPHRPPEIVIL